MIHRNPVEGDPRSDIAFGPTVTILFSDIRGFSEFTNEHGDEAAYRMLQHHNTLVQEQIQLHGGHVVKTQGDSFMVAFDAARTAIVCAVAIQRALDEYNRMQQGHTIQIGIGINSGEPVQESGDYFGAMVNLAARICAVASPSQILVSETVRHLIARLPTGEYTDRGYFDLKGFQEPQHLFEVNWAGADIPPAGEPARSLRKPRLFSVPRGALGKALLALAGAAAVAVLLAAPGILAALEGPLRAAPDDPARTSLVGGLAVGRLLFQDNFSDPNVGLFPRSVRGDGFEHRYLNGQYSVRLSTTPSPHEVVAPMLGGQRFEDVVVEAEASATRLPEAAEYGVGLRGAVGAGHYFFGIKPESQQWRLILRRSRNDYQTLDAGAFPLINRGSEPNRLLVVVKGSWITAYVNGQRVTTVSDDTLAEGWVGIEVIGAQATDAEGLSVAFSVFKVYAVAQ